MSKALTAPRQPATSTTAGTLTALAATSTRSAPARGIASPVASGSMPLPCSTPLPGGDDRPEDGLAAVEHVRRREALGDAPPRRLPERAPARRIDGEGDEPVGEGVRVPHGD